MKQAVLQSDKGCLKERMCLFLYIILYAKTWRYKDDDNDAKYGATLKLFTATCHGKRWDPVKLCDISWKKRYQWNVSVKKHTTEKSIVFIAQMRDFVENLSLDQPTENSIKSSFLSYLLKGKKICKRTYRKQLYLRYHNLNRNSRLNEKNKNIWEFSIRYKYQLFLEVEKIQNIF